MAAEPTKLSIVDKNEIPEYLVGVYTMFFRQHTNSLQTKNFRCSGGLREARIRAERHCNVIGAKLNFVQPLISNLDKEEVFHMGGQLEKEEQIK